MAADEVRAYFQEVSGLGYFCPPWHSRCASSRCQGRGIQGFFEPKVGANSGKAAN